MTTNNTRNWLTALAALSLAACTADTLQPGTEVGQLELPLLSAAADGTQYVLGASFDLTGPEALQAMSDPTAPDWSDDMLVFSPRVGSYQLTISGWTIYRLQVDPATMGVNFAPVLVASLLSNPVQNVSIVQNTTSTVVYQFSVPGSGVINFARGTLAIDFAVQQGLPDGSACADDTECQSHVCASGVCNTASCSDGVQNGGETSPDCGAGCPCTGMTVVCTQTQAVQCPDPTTCTFNPADQTIDCGTPGMYGPCNATQALTCPDPMNCAVNLADQTVICGTPASTCDPQDPATCPAGEACQSDAAGTFNCYGAQFLIDPNLACIKINEFKTGSATDSFDEFVELYNTCDVPVTLAGTQLVYRAAAGTSDINQHTFTSGPTIAGGGFSVLGNSGYTGNFTVTLAGNMSQNAGGMALLHPDGSVIDAVGWQNAITSVSNIYVEGMPALAAPTGSTLSRLPNGNDTNNNGADFATSVPTPDAPN